MTPISGLFVSGRVRTQRRTPMLTVFVRELVLDVLAEEFLYGVTDLLLLLQDVLVVLSVVSLGDRWEQTHTHHQWSSN